jgi:carboxypeptidase Q
MRYQRLAVLGCAALVAIAPIGAQDRPAGDAGRVLEQMRREGLDRSQVITAFDQFVTVIGPRLTGSPAHKAAADWARDRAAGWGLKDARLEPWEFGRGWTLEQQVIEIVEPRYFPLTGYAEAWSASTKGDLVGTPVMTAGRSAAEIAAMKDKLAGAIVLTQPVITGFIREDRQQPTTSDTPVRIGAPPAPGRGGGANQADARAIAQTLREAGAGVLLRGSAGEHGTVFVQSGRDQGENAMPSIILAAEHYNMVARMVEKGVPVKMRVSLRTKFLSADTKSYNVIADLPGTDARLKDDVVLIGAHLDSWHTGTGATDNADGAAVVLEAMRILKTIDAKPRRTIRMALWSGEEQGLLGSKAYVKQHLEGDANKPERDHLAAYFNLDPGLGPIYGWYLEQSAGAKELFDGWLRPLTSLDARRNIDASIGSTDHLSFKAVGVPGFNPVQDYTGYDVRMHHTNVDTYERVREQDLKQNAIVLAWFAWNAAMLEGPFPRDFK